MHTVMVPRDGSLVVNVAVPGVAPAAVGSTCTLKSWNDPGAIGPAEEGVMVNVPFVPVTVALLMVRFCAPGGAELVMRMFVPVVAVPAAATDPTSAQFPGVPAGETAACGGTM